MNSKTYDLIATPSTKGFQARWLRLLGIVALWVAVAAAVTAFDGWFEGRFGNATDEVVVDHSFELTELIMRGDSADQAGQFLIRNVTNEPKKLVLHARFRHIERLNVTLISQGELSSILYADEATRYRDKPEAHRWLKRTFTLQPHQQLDLEIESVDSIYGYTPMYLFEASAFDKYDWFHLANSGLLIAVLAFFTVAALVIGISMRSPLFLCFALVQGSYLIYELYIQNYLHVLFWPDLPQFNLHLSGYLGLLTAFSVLLFARSLFSSVLDRTRILRFADLCLWFTVVSVFIVTLDYSGAVRNLVYSVAGVNMLVAMLLALRAYFRGVNYAYYYLAGWTFLEATFITFTLASTGENGINMLLSNLVVEWGLMLDGTCFTIALIMRLMSDARSKRLLQEAYTRSLRSNFELANERDRAQREVIEKSKQLASQAHDIRQPLYAIRLHAEQIEDSSIRKGIIDSAKALDGFASSTLATQESLAKTAIQEHELTSILATIVTRYKPLFTEQSMQVRVSCDPGCQVRLANITPFDRLLTNALVNCTQHGLRGQIKVDVTSDVGIEIRIENPAYKPNIEPFAKAAKDFWVISGVPNPDEMGSGIGLLTMYRLAEELDIEIDFEVEEKRVAVIMRLPKAVAYRHVPIDELVSA